MHLSKYGVEHYQPGPTTTPTIPSTDWQASFDGGATWHTAIDVDGGPAWLVAGALAATPGAAVVLPDVAWVAPALGFHDGTEFIIRDATFPEGQRPPAIHLDD